MSLGKQFKRKDLTEKIQNANPQMDQMYLTAIRAIGPDEKGKPQIQAEFAQLRMLEGQRFNVLAALNEEDDRFTGSGTLLFNWMKTYPGSLLRLFPELKLTTEELEKVAESWTENDPRGPESIVYAVVQPINKMEYKGKNYTPIINVTEVLESTIRAGKFFTANSKRQAENIAGALEEEYRIMRTNSNDDSEYIVDGETGDRIFRYTQVNAVESRVPDVLIPNKMSETRYKLLQAEKPATTSNSMEDIFDETSKNLSY